MKFTKIEKYIKSKHAKNPTIEKHYEVNDKKVKEDEYQKLFNTFFEPKKNLIPDRKLNIIEVIDLLEDGDNLYATNVETNISYKYAITSMTEGLYQIDKNLKPIITSIALPINKKTLLWQFKINLIDKRKNGQRWVNCSLQEALHKKEEGVSIRSINDKGETILLYDKEAFTRPFIKHSVMSLLEDIKKNHKWQYLKK